MAFWKDKLKHLMPSKPFVPTVLDIAAATTCPRISLLKLIYGASGEVSPSMAIGTVTHSVLAELGKIESKIIEDVQRDSCSVAEIANRVHRLWLLEAETKINESWRVFADAQLSIQEGRRAVIENLRGFSRHLAYEVRQGYRQPDQIVTGHHIIDLELPLEGVPDEYRIFRNPLRVEVREFKSYGGSKVTESNKLQACGYQLLLEKLYPGAEFRLKVYSRDNVVNVRFTEKRRQKLLHGIEAIVQIYEKALGPAKPIPQICSVCSVNEACRYYFKDTQPPHIRKYLWKLRMETLEEKGQNQAWKWKSKLIPKTARIDLGITDDGYRISETRSKTIRLLKNGRPNVLPGDTVIVSGGNPLTTPSFTGEVSQLEENSVTIVPYGDLPLVVPDQNLAIDLYNVDMTRRQLRSIDNVHRAQGRTGELVRRILGVEKSGTPTNLRQIQFIASLNEDQEYAVRTALSAPDYSVILGPPGTGKTAVIVELLAQLARDGKRALAVSITNTAVDNIVERLLDQGHRFGIRFGNWYKIRERALEVALINVLTGEEDLALAAVDKMKSAAAVLTTCSSASLELVRAGHFDVIIFEESSQIRMQDAFAALTQGERAIIIGDDKQLPPVSQSHKPINSLLEIALATLTRHNLTSHLMRELRLQYRMRTEICDIVNHTFYEGKLKSAPSILTRPRSCIGKQDTDPSQLASILDSEITIGVIDVEGVEEYRGFSTFNLANLTVDLRLLEAFNASGVPDNCIGTITPYKEQQRLLAKALGKAANIGTVDSFQGQEKDIVILDMVRANPEGEVGFTLDPNRLNVALSRARDKLIIVINLATYQKSKQFNGILERIKSLPRTRLERVTANQLGVKLPVYRQRSEVQILYDMHLTEPEQDSPAFPITSSNEYFEIA